MSPMTDTLTITVIEPEELAPVGRLGEWLFAEGVTLIDDPFRPRGMGSTPFDDEGVAKAPLKLIEDGIPVAPLPFGIGRKAN